jgi:thiol-disulfide isomerase/thioredoxin
MNWLRTLGVWSIVGWLALSAAEPLPPNGVTTGTNAPAVSILPADPVAAWKLIQKAGNPPLPPAEWNRRQPSKDEMASFRLLMATNAARAADMAGEFRTLFPTDGHAEEARGLQREMLQHAVSLGLTDRSKDLAALGEEPGTPAGGAPASAPAKANDPVNRRLMEAVTAARKHESEGMPAMMEEFEKQVRAIQKEFPKRQETYGALLEIAQQTGGEKGEALMKEVEAAADAGTIPAEFKNAVAGIREQAEVLNRQKERVGKPLQLKFAAVDGRAVDLSAMKGKVVLVDFWATWCGPCVAELPHVKAAYDQFHEQGFEIVGISLDQEKESLVQFTKARQMPWPQYFDGEGWGNKFAKEFGITGIPAMWLVDREGRLVDLEARDGLADKVGRMLKAK